MAHRDPNHRPGAVIISNATIRHPSYSDNPRGVIVITFEILIPPTWQTGLVRLFICSDYRPPPIALCRDIAVLHVIASNENYQRKSPAATFHYNESGKIEGCPLITCNLYDSKLRTGRIILSVSISVNVEKYFLWTSDCRSVSPVTCHSTPDTSLSPTSHFKSSSSALAGK